MQSILRDCNGLTVYGPSNFTPQVVMILGGRHSGRGQARKEWAPVLRGQGEAAGSLGTRKHDSPDVAPADDLGTPQPPGLQETTFCCLSASLRDLQQYRKRQGSLIVKKTGLFDSEGQGSLACCSS